MTKILQRVTFRFKIKLIIKLLEMLFKYWDISSIQVNLKLIWSWVLTQTNGEQQRGDCSLTTIPQLLTTL